MRINLQCMKPTHLLIVVAVLSCSLRNHEASEPNTSQSLALETINVSDNIDVAVAALKAKGAEDITSKVGIKSSLGPSKWMLLPSSTCVRMVYDKKLAIVLIEAGEIGKGYGGKESWLSQNVTRIKGLKLNNGRISIDLDTPAKP